MKIHVNSFVKRQTPESEFSHFHPNSDTDSWVFLENMLVGFVATELDKCGYSILYTKPITEKMLVDCTNIKQGYRDGVILINIPFDPEDDHVWFYSGVCTLTEGDVLQGSYKTRRPGETPRKSVGVVGATKSPAKSAFVVLYSSEVLAEDGSNELPALPGNYEIISINASPCEGEMPINPNVLMHNHFGSDGGTDTNLSDSEFVTMLRESFLFWKDKAMVCPEKDNE